MKAVDEHAPTADSQPLPDQREEPRKKREKTPGSGPKKGVPTKRTILLKEMILTALSNVGGAEYLQKQALLNPTAFMTLVGKVLPTQMVDGGGEPRVPRPVHYQIITSDGTTEGSEGANIGAPGLTSADAPASTQGTGVAPVAPFPRKVP